VTLSIEGNQLEFIEVPMRFNRHGIVNLFTEKNNKTVAETLSSARYSALSEEVQRRYATFLDDRLGEFLYGLKLHSDSFYLRFLNRHGDGVFCDFSIEKTVLTKKKGVYCFAIGERVQYVGQSRVSFEKRINQGYGHVSPKNCYRDGQSTNCHINSLIAKDCAVVSLHVCPIEETSEIDRWEARLIGSSEPEWNVQVRRDAQTNATGW
jgi:hypothetical protein